LISVFLIIVDVQPASVVPSLTSDELLYVQTGL
jgi:hypothetical protein